MCVGKVVRFSCLPRNLESENSCGMIDDRIWGKLLL